MNLIKKILVIVFSFSSLILYSSFKPSVKQKDLWRILEKAFKKKASFEKNYKYYNTLVKDVRKKAFYKFHIPLDTANITSCIVINQVSLGPMTDIYGKIIINDSLVYNYYEDMLTKELITTKESLIFSDSLIVSMLQAHQFIELGNIASKESKEMSGSFFYYIAYYDKNWDCTYARILPAFIKDDSNYR